MAIGGRHGSPGVFALAASLLLLSPCVLAAPKTDIVTLKNGDRFTGEIKGLEQGQLKFKTDAAGTIYIEWAKIATLKTDQYFQVEMASGERYTGRAPSPGEVDKLRIAGEEDALPLNLPLADVIRLDPIERGQLLKRLDGYVTAGYDYTKANDLQTFTFTGGLNSRSEIRAWTIDGSSTLTSQQGNDDSNRWTVNAGVRRFLQQRWFYQGFGGLEGNDELALDLRTLVGGAFGRYLQQDNDHEWAAYAGLAYNRENYSASDRDGGDSLEGVLGTQYSFFRYDTPEASLDGVLNLYPSLTQSGRIRGEGKLRSRYELVKDLFFEISLYGSYDSDPSKNAESDSDYGLTTSLGYSF
jgi:hypothetical protein